jgi:hypothetical protein
MQTRGKTWAQTSKEMFDNAQKVMGAKAQRAPDLSSIANTTNSEVNLYLNKLLHELSRSDPRDLVARFEARGNMVR